MKTLKIGTSTIGDDNPVFIVAEISANHLQKYDLALKTIESARNAGADAVKLQTYTPDTITLDCDNEFFQIKQGTIWDGVTLHQLYQEAHTPWDWQPKLKKYAEDLGLICFSSPFDKSAVDFLETMDVPAYKVASFEITDIPLIEYMASKMKPMIISTGIAELSDIEEAIAACRNVGNDNIVLLKCTSAYPTPLSDVNLRIISDIPSRFNTLVGLSDHTTGISVSVAAVALGACMVEKHITTSRELGGPDAAFSLEPEEFKEMVTTIREVEQALGKIDYTLTEKMKSSREFSRSLFVTRDVQEGEILTAENVRSIRPGYGLPPKYEKQVLGKRAKKAIKKGTPLDWDLID
ncbi:MAG: pseudaminic acid synthase [Candidatus Thorarchaeota archaeon]|jgi:pseudaminic acid synthase